MNSASRVSTRSGSGARSVESADIAPQISPAAGSPVQLAIYPGAPHEFLNLRDAIPVASDARERMVGFIDRVLSETGRSPEPVSL